MRKYRTKTTLALLLCVGLLCALVQPLSAYASYDDEYVEEYDSYADSYDDESGDDVYEDDGGDVDEPTGSSGGSAILDELYAERDQINATLDSLKQQQQALQQEIAGAQTVRAQAEQKRDSIASEISIRVNTIASLEERIRNLTQEIAVREDNILEKQAEIDYNYELLKKRLRAMYMQDDGTMLGLLLGSDDFGQFLCRSEYMVRVADHDTALMQELTDQRIGIEEEKAELEDAVLQQEQDKAEVLVEKQKLDEQHSEAASEVMDIARMEQEYMANLARNKALQDAEQAKLNDVFQRIEWSKNPYSGGVMQWPLPGYSAISSGYGSRFGGNDFHTGMDITGSGCYGATIVAANDGIVKFVNTSYSDGVGYGIYLIIDHGVDENGNQVATLYAHCSSITVGLGQSVSRGDPIAKVGSTGWSTGPHLHFEVRINNSSVEPSQYL